MVSHLNYSQSQHTFNSSSCRTHPIKPGLHWTKCTQNMLQTNIQLPDLWDSLCSNTQYPALMPKYCVPKCVWRDCLFRILSVMFHEQRSVDIHYIRCPHYARVRRFTVNGVSGRGNCCNHNAPLKERRDLEPSIWKFLMVFWRKSPTTTAPGSRRHLAATRSCWKRDWLLGNKAILFDWKWSLCTKTKRNFHLWWKSRCKCVIVAAMAICFSPYFCISFYMWKNEPHAGFRDSRNPNNRQLTTEGKHLFNPQMTFAKSKCNVKGLDVIISCTKLHITSPLLSMTTSCWNTIALKISLSLYPSWRHSSETWLDLVIFYWRKGPFNHAKFQGDLINSSAIISEKRMRFVGCTIHLPGQGRL